ncbi:MAG: hypothetical protein K2K56_12650 [Lachnospiraceae bacterium]|nr:hypothetical protein [Lachnospiraceae bacterium]
MKKKDKLDYIYFCVVEGKRRRLEMVCRELSEIRTLRVCITEKNHSAGGRRQKDAIPYWRRIRRRLRDWQTEDCTVGADWRMAEWLQMKEELFLARKQELMQNRNELLEKMGGGIKGEVAVRKSFLLVLGSNGWSRQDLLLLLSAAKDYFADIYMVTGNGCIDEEQMVESVYEEWGIVMHLLSEESARAEAVDCALFLLESWNEAVREYHCRFGYVVSECENGMNRCRNSEVGIIKGTVDREKSGTIKGGGLYSGMVYKCRGEEIPYQMAVNMKYQNPEKYHKFSITSVAIYCVE